MFYLQVYISPLHYYYYYYYYYYYFAVIVVAAATAVAASAATAAIDGVDILRLFGKDHYIYSYYQDSLIISSSNQEVRKRNAMCIQ